MYKLNREKSTGETAYPAFNAIIARVCVGMINSNFTCITFFLMRTLILYEKNIDPFVSRNQPNILILIS